MRLEKLLSRKADNFDDFRDNYPSFVSNLQANILKHHSKPEAVFAFITFTYKDGNKVDIKKKRFKEWLRNLNLTSAEDQSLSPKKREQLISVITKWLSSEKLDYKDRSVITEKELNLVIGELKNKDLVLKEKIKIAKKKVGDKKFPPIITCFYLSFEGYSYLEEKNKPRGETNAFEKGLMKQTVFGNMSNSMDNKFRDHYKKEKEIHALLMIASNEDALNLQNKRSQIKNEIEKVYGFGTVTCEFAKLIQKDPQNDEKIVDLKTAKTVEWFGYRDGISNPRFFPSYEAKNSSDSENPSKLNLVLKPSMGTRAHSSGSFMVFLKLQQNTKAFKESSKRLAIELYGKISADPNIAKNQIDFAGALMIGRHKDGTPLTQSGTPIPGDNNNLNKFNYSNDKEGAYCPFHAHIRKSNPREGNENGKIVRRGMMYGNQEAENKGLFFMSFQRDLEQQFEYILDRMNQEWWNGENTGKDPLISKRSRYRKYSRIWGSDSSGFVSAPIDDLFTFKGGLYFFAPSISYIKENLGVYL